MTVPKTDSGYYPPRLPDAVMLVVARNVFPLLLRVASAAQVVVLAENERVSGRTRDAAQMNLENALAALVAASKEEGGMSRHWLLKQLEEDPRERVLEAMRAMRVESEDLRKQHLELSPPAGQIAVGGAHMDPLFAQVALDEFLSALGGGATPEVAAIMAGSEVRKAVDKWNRSREHQVHRDPGCQDAFLRGKRSWIEMAASVCGFQGCTMIKGHDQDGTVTRPPPNAELKTQSCFTCHKPVGGTPDGPWLCRC